MAFRGPWDETEWTSYHPDAERLFTAWANGLNAWVTQNADNLPVEFKLTGIKPELWKPETVLLRTTGLGDGSGELQLARLVARVGAKEANRQRMPDPWDELVVPEGLDVRVIFWRPNPESSHYGRAFAGSADDRRLYFAALDYSGDIAFDWKDFGPLVDAYRKLRNTYRALVGNLFDFKPEKDALPYDQLQPLEKGALAEAAQIDHIAGSSIPSVRALTTRPGAGSGSWRRHPASVIYDDDLEPVVGIAEPSNRLKTNR